MADQRGVDLVQHRGRASQLRHRGPRSGQDFATAGVGRGASPSRWRAEPADVNFARPGGRRPRSLVHPPGLSGISAQVGARKMTREVGINQLKRRDFLKAGLVFGAGASGIAAGYAAVPDAFARAVYAAKKEGVNNDNVLVMIQLAGGNDGLRTLVPLADPTLHDLRPKLAGSMVSQALPLNSQYGLNHKLGGMKKLWDKGNVAIV